MKKLLKITFILFSVAFLSGCFMLKRYVYTDKELEERYQNKVLKPRYADLSFIDRKLHYAIMSKSDTLPLLVLIHGAPGAWYGYMNLMDDSLLQQNFKMVSVDRPGYGSSGYGQAELSTQMQALAIKAMIEKENTSHKKVYLLGRSYGAPIAAWLAIHYPLQVERLLLVSPVIDPDREKYFWFNPIGKFRPVQWMLPEALNTATREKYAHAAEMKKMLPQWQKLYTPTYVVTGADDQIADTANFSFAKHHIVNAQAKFFMLKNTGHRVTAERPGFIKGLLLDQL